MLKLGNKDIVGIYHGSDGVSYVYLGNTLVYSKEAPPQAPCFEVVDNITAYTANSYTDVYDLATSKWYKLNNLNQYEEYGLYGSGRTISYYVGKLTIDDGNEYEWDGTGWDNLGEVSSTTIPDNYVIQFEDSNVKTICVNNWGGNVVTGELTYGEAKAVTSLGNVFRNNKTITKFNELTYFTGLSALTNGEFAGCTNLLEIVIPANVTDLGYCQGSRNTFSGCTNLSGLTILTGDGTEPLLVSGNFNNNSYWMKSNHSSTPWVFPNRIMTFEGCTFGYADYCTTGYFQSATPPVGLAGADISNYRKLATIYCPIGASAAYTAALNGLTKTVIEYDFSTDANNVLNREKQWVIGNTTTYPKYYTQKSAPDNNLVFTDMAEAEAYQCPWVGMFATIGGVLYEYTDNGWYRLPFTITGVTKSSTNFTMKINGVDETAHIFADNGDNTYNYGVVYTNPITGITCSGNSNIMTIDYSGATTTGWTSISNMAFQNCSGLTSFVIPSGVTSIDSSAFYNCSGLTSINIPSGVTSIGNYAFYNCRSLTSITIPSGITSIGESVFVYCTSLTSINIPSGVTSIGNSAFAYCSGLTSINIPSGVTSIGSFAFQNCSSLTSINIPSGVTTIEHHTFYGCSGLTSITIPSGVTEIRYYAFGECRSLTSITIPSGVTNIGNNAFYNCTNLTNVTIPSGLTSLGASAFCECHAAFTNGVVIPSAITSIPDSAFFGCNALTSVALHSGITNVSNQGFGYCNLTGALDIPDSVTTIGNYAFRNNETYLTSVTIGSGVTSIGERAFWRCYHLTGITVNATTPPTLGTDAFLDTNNCPIYVPSGSVTDYQTAWSTYASRIQAIPTPTPPSPDYSTVVEDLGNDSYLITVWFEYDQDNERLNGLYTGATTLLLPQGYTKTGNLTIEEEEDSIGVGYEITYFDNLSSSPYIEVDIPLSASVSVQFELGNVGSDRYFYIEDVPSELFNWSDGTKYKFEIEADNLEV